MVGPENYLASLVTALFATRLVTVCSSSLAFFQSDYSTGRILKVKSTIGEAIGLF